MTLLPHVQRIKDTINHIIMLNRTCYLRHSLSLFMFMLLALLLHLAPLTNAKVVEGQLKTLDDWAFLSRFCFISGSGRFEYLIEFERRYGEPQLLLYYDDVSQWPAVYKTQTTCQQKVSVLSNSDHQIVTLTARPPHNFYSGCTLQTRYPDNKPGLPISTQWPPHGGIGGADTVTSYYDQFLTTGSTTAAAAAASTLPTMTDDDSDGGGATTTTESLAEWNDTSTAGYDLLDINDELWNFTGYNDTDVFNATKVGQGLRHGGAASSSLWNSLENGTAFRDDVEQMFAESSGTDDDARVRMRRSMPTPLNFKREGVGTVLVQCNNIGGFTSSRERWWYIAIANCGSRKGLDLKYKFRLTNGPRGDFWHEHFSADEMYILPIYLSESLLYSFLLVAIFICSIELRTLHLLHCTYRLYAFSVCLQWLGVLLQGIAYSMYGVTGLAPRTLLGSLFTGASEVCFLILMLLLAKGYTITRARLSSLSAIKLTIFVNIYMVVFVSLFVFQAETFDPGEVLNLYESPAGVALGVLRVAAWAAFVVSTVNTLKKNPEKARFYVPFGVLGSLWIMGGPLTTVFGVAVLDPWVRESVICFVLAAIAFGGHLAFLYLTWPSRANKSFPYHVRTNHVGIASTEDDGADYPRHTYEPSLADQNTIIPLSRRTEELLTSAYGSYLFERTSAPEDDTERRPPPVPLVPRRPSNVPKSAPAARIGHQGPNGTPPLPRHAANNHHNYDNNDDSGHPSLETSTSISPNDTVPTSAEESPNTTRRPNHHPPIGNADARNEVDDAAPAQMFNGAVRPNPFIVNGVQRAPNKVILEPIERPLAELALPLASATSARGGGVPRHLFAAKNPHNL